ncbi:crocetin glucosyltransferase 2-like [Iris pallida]|uniref:Crocetin glucosyltransferase 2-like n=1 Tax=Iris pallida TaxID=29817 RepID=A0AAX6FC07_IRIPA|nr:crocetin glucosyltransferase 2-like [Iris pallida]
MEPEKNELGQKPHILLVPYPAQGHITPLLQFGKRLASHNVEVTLATTRFLNNLTKPEPGPVSFESISDGFDSGGFSAAPSVGFYLDRLEAVGSQTLSDLIVSLQSGARPVHVLVYDPFVPWAAEVARWFGLRCTAFFTQSCAVDAIYGHAWAKRIQLPVAEPVRMPGLGLLEPRDLPSFLTDKEPVPYPDYLALLLNQYKGLERADAVLINSFYELEHQVSSCHSIFFLSLPFSENGQISSKLCPK